MSDGKFSSDPQVVPYHDGPELVPGQDGYSCGSKSWAVEDSGKETYNLDGSGLEVYNNEGPEVVDVRQHLQDDGEGYGEKTMKPEKKGRICGLKRGAFVAVLVVIIMVVLGAVLGGVLGTVLSSTSDNSSGSSGNFGSSSASNGLALVQNLTGVAVAQSDSNSLLYQYYQDGQGRIIENQYLNGKWLINGDNVPVTAIVALDAILASPLAATTWPHNGITYRQVFYVDSASKLKTTNTSVDDPWPPGFEVLEWYNSYYRLDASNAVEAGSIAMTASSDTNQQGLNGIRAYYASRSGQIQEVGYDFSGKHAGKWFLWNSFEDSDIKSGVGFAVADLMGHVYVRSSSTGALYRWSWNYAQNKNTTWQQGSPGPNLISGTDLAAVHNGDGTDSVFSVGSDGDLTRAISDNSSISRWTVIGTAQRGSRLAAIYDSSSSAAVVYYQGVQSNETIIAYQGVRTDGTKTLNGTAETG